MGIRFGPAGNWDGFYDQGYKHSYQAPGALAALGLNAYEYSAGHGINIKQPGAEKIGSEGNAHGVAISVHAPYFINFANTANLDKNIDYLRRSAQAVRWMGGNRVVFHPGSCSGLARAQALQAAADGIQAMTRALGSEFNDILFCPETLGKQNQLGTVEEVVTWCTIDECLCPAIDFGHVHARGQGSLRSQADYAHVLDDIENRLGAERLRCIHVHFSHVGYTAAGEKKHLTNADREYGPFFEPLAREIVRRNMQPVIICESAGTQAEDALEMKQIYCSIIEEETL